jgi:hypothetical protein
LRQLKDSRGEICLSAVRSLLKRWALKAGSPAAEGHRFDP